MILPDAPSATVASSVFNGVEVRVSWATSQVVTDPCAYLSGKRAEILALVGYPTDWQIFNCTLIGTSTNGFGQTVIDAAVRFADSTTAVFEGPPGPPGPVGPGSTIPTGTGLYKLIGGIMVAAAALLVNADVDNAAAIAPTKLALAGSDGQVLRRAAGVNGWGAVNLASVNAVTGILPTANQAPQAMGGDVAGTTAINTITNLAVSKLTPSGTNTWVLTTVGGVATWAAAGAGGITQLTSDVTAGPGSGSQAATVVAATGAGGFLPLASTAAVLRWAAATTAPGIQQLQSTTGAGTTFTLSGQAARAGFAEAGGAVRFISGAPDGVGTVGSISMQTYGMGAGVGIGIVSTAAYLAATNNTFYTAFTNGDHWESIGTGRTKTWYENFGLALTWSLRATGTTSMAFASTTTPLITQDTATSDVLPQNITLQAQAPFPGAPTVANRGAGSVVVNISANVAGALNNGGFDIQYAGTPIVKMGQINGGSTAAGALWMGPNAAAPTLLNYTAYTTATVTALKGGSFVSLFAGATGDTNLQLSDSLGLLYFGKGGFQYQFDLAATAVFRFKNVATSASIVYDGPASDVATKDLTLQAQAPAGPTFKDPGAVVVNIPAHIAGSTHRGGFDIKYNGTNLIKMGEYVGGGSTIASIWAGSGAVTPSATNYILSSDGVTTSIFGGSTIDGAGNGYLLMGLITTGGTKIAGAVVRSSTFSLGDDYVTSNLQYQFDLSNTAKFHFTTTATTAGIIYDAHPTSAGNLLTIKSQSAGGVNHNGGSLILSAGDKTGSGSNGNVFVAGANFYLYADTTLGNYGPISFALSTATTAIQFSSSVADKPASIGFVTALFGAGQTLTIVGQTATAASGLAGGNIVITPGAGDGAGATGSVVLSTLAGSGAGLVGISNTGVLSFASFSSIAGSVTLAGDVTGAANANVVGKLTGIAGTLAMASTAAALVWAAATATPSISQAIATAGSGQSLSITAQAAFPTGGGNGGALNLAGGAKDGAGAVGMINLNTPTKIATSQWLQFGTGTMATAGDIRIGSGGGSIHGMNTGLVVDCNLMQWDGANNVIIGAASGVLGVGIYSGSLTYLYTPGTIYLDGASVSLRGASHGSSVTYDFSSEPNPNLQIGATMASWIVQQLDTAVPNATGAPSTYRAQNSTNGSTTGGALNLGSGYGTVAHGTINFQVGGTTRGRFSGTDNLLWVGNVGASEMQTRIGPMPGATTNYAGLWALPQSTATTAVNMIMYSDGSGAYFNTPAAAGTIFFVDAGSTFIARMSTALGFHFANTPAQTAQIYQDDVATLNTAGKTFTFQAQNTTNGTAVGGDFVIKSGSGVSASVTTAAQAGTVRIFSAAAELVTIAPSVIDVGNNWGGTIRLRAAATSYNIMGPTNHDQSVATGGVWSWLVNNVNWMTVTPVSSGATTMTLASTVTAFTLGWTTSATTVGGVLTVAGQSAGGSNQWGGDVVIQTGAKTGIGHDGTLRIKLGANEKAQFEGVHGGLYVGNSGTDGQSYLGPQSGLPAQSALYLLGNAGTISPSNYTLSSYGAHLNVNAISTQLALTIAQVQFFACDGTNSRLNMYYPVQFDFAATASIYQGQAATATAGGTLTITAQAGGSGGGARNGGAINVISGTQTGGGINGSIAFGLGGIASPVLTLAPVATIDSAVFGAAEAHKKRAILASYTFDASGPDWLLLVSTAATRTITLPLASSFPGRIVGIADSTGQAASQNITLTPATGDSISGYAANVSASLTTAWGYWWYISDGTTTWYRIG